MQIKGFILAFFALSGITNILQAVKAEVVNKAKVKEETKETTKDVAKEIHIIQVEDMINTGTSSYILNAIAAGEQKQAELLIIRMDTPGGMLESTRNIVKGILNAKIPVVVFIGPKGARAGSAGVMITMAAHIAVMAPGTNIGAAHPVNFDGKDAGGEDIKRKIVNDTAAFAKSIAKERGRNEDWAVAAVKESVSVTSDEALEKKVIDFIAEDLNDLLQKVNGRSIKIGEEQKVINIKGASKISIEMSLKEQFLTFLGHPNVAYLLMTFGGLGLYIELTHPGMLFPGIIGVISILLSLICFNALSINMGALGLLLIGVALLISEMFVTSFGVLGIGGIVSFLIGSWFLIDSPFPEVALSPYIIVPTAVAFSIIMLTIGFLLIRTRNTKPITGINGLKGRTQIAGQDVPTGIKTQILFNGEIWNAISSEDIKKGQEFKVEDVDGLILKISLYDKKE